MVGISCLAHQQFAESRVLASRKFCGMRRVGVLSEFAVKLQSLNCPAACPECFSSGLAPRQGDLSALEGVEVLQECLELLAVCLVPPKFLFNSAKHLLRLAAKLLVAAIVRAT